MWNTVTRMVPPVATVTDDYSNIMMQTLGGQVISVIVWTMYIIMYNSNANRD